MNEEEFWADLLAHIRHQVLIPVVGPGVTVAKTANTDQRLTQLIGQRLAETYDLAVSPEVTTDEAVGAFLRKRGRDEVDRLYRRIDDIIVELDPEPGDALRDLAAIDDLRLFVSTTPDRLLAKALNESRHGLTREIPFSPYQSTSEQAQYAQQAAELDTVVLNLFGQTASTPQYAIHEEDRLEWIHTLLTERTSLPEWLDYPLKHLPMLFIGCEIPDWLGRFLLRMSSDKRLPLRDKPFFFAGCSTSQQPSLSSFFSTFCRSTLCQQLEMEPTEFVAELRRRWEEKKPKVPEFPPDKLNPPVGVAREAPEIFISYMREDADAAQRLCEAISGLGGTVWFDALRLSPGDSWEQQILSQIRETRLFVPIISANTERANEGYVFKEWKAAVNRAASIMGRRFIVPVIVDADYAGDPSRYGKFPPEFASCHFGQAPGGEPNAALREMLISEIRAMRRTDAA
ncbi:MAG: toll/interleukin-1 receptor domain-containing protein [Vicinamibacterales bacterium]